MVGINFDMFVVDSNLMCMELWCRLAVIESRRIPNKWIS